MGKVPQKKMNKTVRQISNDVSFHDDNDGDSAASTAMPSVVSTIDGTNVLVNK